MNTELVLFTSTDKLELPGVLYTPAKPTERVAIYLHGNGDNGVFYSAGRTNAMGEELAKKGIAFLAFNNRGAHYRKKLKIADETLPEDKQRFTGGAHYELIADCNKDIDGAVAFLKGRGFKEFYLVGFSTGANKICVYDATAKNNPFSKYVHAGPGDDSGLFFNEIGERRFWLSLGYAKRSLEDKKPLQVMPKYTGMHPFSAQAAFDILNPDGAYNTFPYFEATTKRLGKKELFKEYKKITKPMLVIFGEFDEFTYTGGGTQATLGLLKELTNKKVLPRSDFQVVPGTDHGFHGKEVESAKRIAEWLAR